MAVILFDIDGTLFDTRHFGKLYRAGLEEALGINEEVLAAAIADYYSTLEISTDFDPGAFIENISKRFGVEKKIIENIFWKPSYFHESRFEDVKPALEKLSTENQLGIFSQGHKNYQEYKLENEGILGYFDPGLIFIHIRKLTDEASIVLPAGATIVEDKHDVALALSKKANTVWLNRLSEEKDPEMRTIHSLSDL